MDQINFDHTYGDIDDRNMLQEYLIHEGEYDYATKKLSKYYADKYYGGKGVNERVVVKEVIKEVPIIKEVRIEVPRKHKTYKEKLLAMKAILDSAGNDTPVDEDADDKIAEATECNVCADNKKCIIYSPCGHAVTCVGCSRGMVNHVLAEIDRKPDSTVTCPKCRTKITKMQKIYM